MRYILMALAVMLPLSANAATTGHPRASIQLPDLILDITRKDSRTSQQIACVALTVYYESRGESEQGMRAVAYVVMNRWASGDYGRSACEIVWHRSRLPGGRTSVAFSWTITHGSAIPRDREAWREAQRVAYLVYTSRVSDPTDGATHFYAHRLVRPDWARRAVQARTIGGHRFVRLTPRVPSRASLLALTGRPGTVEVAHAP